MSSSSKSMPGSGRTTNIVKIYAARSCEDRPRKEGIGKSVPLQRSIRSSKRNRLLKLALRVLPAATISAQEGEAGSGDLPVPHFLRPKVPDCTNRAIITHLAIAFVVGLLFHSLRGFPLREV